MATLSCAWSTQSARDARCFNGKNLRTHVVDRAMRLPAPHDGTPMFGPSFSTLSEQGRGAARHLDFGRGRNRSGSSRTCSSCRPEHMSCSHHVQGPAVPLERPETPFYVRSRRRGNADWTSRGTAIAKGCMSEHDCLRPKGRNGEKVARPRAGRK